MANYKNKPLKRKRVFFYDKKVANDFAKRFVKAVVSLCEGGKNDGKFVVVINLVEERKHNKPKKEQQPPDEYFTGEHDTNDDNWYWYER